MAVRSALAISLALTLAACGGDDDNDTTSDLHPNIVDDVMTVDEDTPVFIDVLANDSDPAGRPLVLHQANADGHVVTIEHGLAHVMSPPNWNGTIHLSYVVGNGPRSYDGHATITVTPVNDAPTATAYSAATARNTARLLSLAGNDVDGDLLKFEVETQPTHGTLTGTAPSLTYTPAANYIGEDSFVFHTRDAALVSEPATVTINVVAGSTPVAQPQTVTTAEDTDKAITLAGSDSDGDALTYQIVVQPTHGTLTGTPPAITYTPAANFFGTDTFKFVANDGVLTSMPAQVTVSVTPVNDAPVAQALTIGATEDQPVVITLAGSDVDGNPLTYTIVDAPTRGTLTGGTGAPRTYQSLLNANGTDTFTYTVSDGTLTSAPATVTVNVAAVEDAPVATARSVSATEDTAGTITLTGTDPDGDALTFAVGTGPAHGTLTGTPPVVTYTPAANYNGPDSFTFTANDGTMTSAPATMTIGVAAVDDPPVITGAALSGNEGESIAIPLPANDIDGDALTYTVSTAPSQGSILGSGAALSYNSLHANGSFSFALTASDGHSTSAPATFTVAVAPVADPPLANDDVAIADAAALHVPVLANDVELDGEAMHIDSVGTPLHGTVAIDGDDVVYTTTPGNTASDTFTYTVADSTGLTKSATVYIGIGELPTNLPFRFIANAASSATNSQEPQEDVSADGRYIAFVSSYALAPDDTNQYTDIYVYDRMTAKTERVSVPGGGGVADGPSIHPSISADGRYVAFASTATNLVPNDTNSNTDVFVRDRVAGTTTRASVSSTGAQVAGMSNEPDISADGSVVAFVSTAFELVPSDANGSSDIFVRDLAAGTTTRVSVRTGGGEADQPCIAPILSGDGKVVSFTSSATNLVAGDTNARADVFVHDRTSGVTERVSVSSTGIEANNLSSGPAALSYDGRFVAFRSQATNLASGGGIGTYVRDRVGQTTLWLGVNAGGLSLSADGRYLVGHTTTGGVFVRDRFANVNRSLVGSGAYFPVISPNGRYVVLVSELDLDNQSHSSGAKMYVYPNPL